MPASDWKVEVPKLISPGLYLWWIDEAGAEQLSESTSESVSPGHLYGGQAGATRWPSGKTVDATLASRLKSNHLAGGIRSSTFRLTLASALQSELGLVSTGSRKLSAQSEAEISEWMERHLTLTVHLFSDRDPLEDLESKTLAPIEPPLNLKGMPATSLRTRISDERRLLSADLKNETHSGSVEDQEAKEAEVEGEMKVRVRPLHLEKVTLHSEIEAILRGAGNQWMSTSDIAEAVNSRGRYQKKDGTTVSDFQVHGRTRNYDDLFERDGSRVRLIG